MIENSPYNFEIHQIDYSLEATAVTKPMEGTYSLFSKGYVDLATEAAIEAASVEFERAGTGERRRWETRIVHRTYSPLEIAEVMFERLEEADDPQAIGDGTYASEFPIDRLAELVAASLARIGAVVATDRMRQKFLQALGPLRRRVSETVRYAQHVDQYRMASTNSRPADSITAADLRRSKAMFYTDETRGHLIDEQVELFDEVTGDDGAGWRVVPVPNRFDFKTPLSMVIADSDNERRFIRELVKGENAVLIDHWIKSTATRFYEIDYAWKKGAHAKRGKFSPDFFMRTGGLLCVVETKGDEELAEPSEENRKKNEFALAHFQRINQRLSEEGVALQYRFTFLTPRSFNSFFQCLRDGSLASFRSDMDVALVAADDVVG